jgi:hypothetical protein
MPGLEPGIQESFRPLSLIPPQKCYLAYGAGALRSAPKNLWLTQLTRVRQREAGARRESAPWITLLFLP